MIRRREPLTPPHKIAIAGDWHANVSWACSAVYAAADSGADVIVHLGDFGYDFRPRFLGNLTAALAETGLHLLFVDGNHDNHAWLYTLDVDPQTGLRKVTDRIWHIPRGYRWTWGGVRFTGVGGAHSVDGSWRRSNGYMWSPDETITKPQEDLISRNGFTDVLLSHDAPDGVPIPGLRPGLFPDDEIFAATQHRRRLRRIVDAIQPRQIWHGHYHVHYEAAVDLGYGPVHVTGLDMDGTDLRRNLQLVHVDQLAADIALNTAAGEGQYAGR